MNAFLSFFTLLRNAFLVTLAVAIGFTLGSAIGIPIGLQIVCLIPAGYLFIRLIGAPIPPMRSWVPYAVAISITVSVTVLAYGLVRSHFPWLYESVWSFMLISIIAFMPMRLFAEFLEHHWPFGGSDTTSEK